MKNDITILIHYNEIALKGKNRVFFEKKLVDNLRRATGASVKRLSGRILMTAKKEDGLAEKINKIFGVSSFSPVLIAEPDLKDINKKVLEILSGIGAKTFKIETKRGYKQFPLNSMEISREVGAYVLENYPPPACLPVGRPAGRLPLIKGEKRTPPAFLPLDKGRLGGVKKGGEGWSAVKGRARGINVNVKNPDIIVNVEILKDAAYIYTEKIKGFGGLPVGSSGRVLSLLSGGIDSPVASYLMMKRGCAVDFIHFHSYPYSDRASIEKVEEIRKILDEYAPGSRLYLSSIIEFQKEIVKKADPRHRIILYRRLMYKTAEKLAQKIGAKALVSGDNIGQVASQTLENIAVISHGLEIPVLRPLAGFNKEEIVELAKKIGTYEISIEPHEDCCSIFLPKNPATRARMEDIIMEEKEVGMEGWVDLISAKLQIPNHKFTLLNRPLA